MIWVLGNPQYMLEKTLIFGNPTRPNIKNPYLLGTDASSRRLYANLKQFYSKFKHFVRHFGANFFEAKSAMVLRFTSFPCLALV